MQFLHPEQIAFFELLRVFCIMENAYSTEYGWALNLSNFQSLNFDLTKLYEPWLLQQTQSKILFNINVFHLFLHVVH